MATVSEAVRRLTVQVIDRGIDAVTQKLKGLAKAEGDVQVVQRERVRSTDSLANSLASIQRRYDDAWNQQQKLAKVERELQQIRGAGLITASRQNELMQLATDRIKGVTGAANDNLQAFSRLSNMLVSRFIYAAIVAETAKAIPQLLALNAELAKTADIAARIGTSGANLQGIGYAGALKGLDQGQLLDAMLQFNKQVDLAKSGLGSLGTLFRANGVAVTDTQQAFLKVSDLVRNAATEAAKFSVLEQAGLPATREMARFMEQGAASIRKASDEARKFTDQQLQAAQDLDDRWNKMWADFSRWGKAAILEVADFPQQGTPLRALIDWATGAKPFPTIKFEFKAEPGSLLDVLQKMSEQQKGVLKVPVIPVERGPDLPPISAPTQIGTVRPGGYTRDPKKERELLDLEQRRLALLGALAPLEALSAANRKNLNLSIDEGVKLTGRDVAAIAKRYEQDQLGITAIRQQIDAQRIEGDTLMMTTGQAAAYRAVQEKVLENIRNGHPLKAQQIADLEREAAVLGKVIDKNASWLKLEQASSSAFSGIISDISTGVNAMDVMINRVGQLGKSMTDIGSKSLFDSLKGMLSGGGLSFDPVSLGIGAAGVGISLITSFLGEQKKAEEQARRAKEAWAGMADQVRNFNAAAEGFDLSPYVTAIQQIKNSALDMIKTAVEANDIAGAMQVIISGARQINNQVDQYIRPKGNSVAEQIAQENANAQQLINELNDLNARYGLGLNRTNDILAAAAEHILEIQRKAEEEINKRRAQFQDRVFSAANDDAAPKARDDNEDAPRAATPRNREHEAKKAA